MRSLNLSEARPDMRAEPGGNRHVITATLRLRNRLSTAITAAMRGCRAVATVGPLALRMGDLLAPGVGADSAALSEHERYARGVILILSRDKGDSRLAWAELLWPDRLIVRHRPVELSMVDVQHTQQ
jgi:hypothetical protein